MKRIFTVIILLFAGHAAWPAETGQLMHADVDLSDQSSLQRGATIFVNYCQSCHSAAYMRYSRMGHDLGITEEVLKQNLMFGTDKPGDMMTSSLGRDDAVQFFAVMPPDLSVTARARGADWLYTYFMTFYLDPGRPTGMNNLVFKDVAMPHVLWKKQGLQRAVVKETKNADGSIKTEVERLELETPGELNEAEYAAMVQDLVNFLVYMGEPARLKRYTIGGWVMVYLLVLLLVVYLLKKEYWRDVH
jgi:ubiquinol-cytochrome c reductase cytochrome c1 subunit